MELSGDTHVPVQCNSVIRCVKKFSAHNCFRCSIIQLTCLSTQNTRTIVTWNVKAIVFNCTGLAKNALLRALLLLLVVVVVISFMQGIYNYIPETKHVAKAAILWLPFMVHLMLFPMSNLLHYYISISRSMCSVSNMAVFCSSLISCFAGVRLSYFSEWFWVGSSCPHYLRYHFCFCTAHALYFHCEVFMF